VIYPVSKIRPVDVTDGLSKTVLIAESREEKMRVWIDGRVAANTALDGDPMDTVPPQFISLNYTPYYDDGDIFSKYGLRACIPAERCIYWAMVRCTSSWTRLRRKFTWRCARGRAEKISKMSSRVLRVVSLVGLCMLVIGCGDSSAKRIAKLQSPDAKLRRAAVRALFEQPKLEDEEIDALAKSVADSDSEVRNLSIDALGNLGPQGAAGLPSSLKPLRIPIRACR